MSHRRRRTWLFVLLVSCAAFRGALDFQQPGPPIRAPWSLRVVYVPGYGPQLGWRAEFHDDGSGFLERDPCATPAPDAIRKRTDFRLAPKSLSKLKASLNSSALGV